jgi:pyruvate kinase
MIHSCRSKLKPAIVATQVLESMLTKMTPTFTEMGDISNVVREYIDGIMLTGETTYGHHPLEVITALNRVCRKVEQKLISDKLSHPNLRDHSYIYNSEMPIASSIA